MAKSLSPLRYPGGKSKIYDKVKNLIETNELGDRIYVEPFAGGFGIGISLLCDNIVQQAILNDFDSHIYHFWHSVLHNTDDLLRMINDTPITIEEREKQKAVYNDDSADVVRDGFATLFLNRVNFSGVITGGPIGGLTQSGAYRIDCRFNKDEIKKKTEKIALLENRISLFNCDAGALISTHLGDRTDNSFFNIDPPYVKNGHRLYANYFVEEDHRKLSEIIIERLREAMWILTYDDCDLIRDIYRQYLVTEYNLQHNAAGSVMGKELVITNIPQGLFMW